MTTKQIQSFMLWLRKEKISYHTITIGGVTLDGVVDGKYAASAAKAEPRRTMYEEYGAELLKQPVSAADDVPEEAKLDD